MSVSYEIKENDILNIELRNAGNPDVEWLISELKRVKHEGSYQPSEEYTDCSYSQAGDQMV